jgi:hypothetical protein
MTAFSFDSYILLITLILTIVSLFLCLYNALLLYDASKRINHVMHRSGTVDGQGKTRTFGKRQVRDSAISYDCAGSRASLKGQEDINAGIGTVAGKYQINSLVVATPDGLVVASAGSSDPEYDAARYSSLFAGTYTMPDQGVWLLPLDHRGIPLVGIARSPNVIPREMASRMAEEIKMVFERGL